MKKISSYSAMETEGILLNANESYKNLSEGLIKEIQEAMGSVLFHRYPEDSNKELVEAYASYIKKDADCIMAGNGSDEVLGTIIGLTMKEGKKLYTLSLDFSMYDYYTSMHNGEMLKYPYAIDSEFNVDDFIKMGKDNEVDMILFSNPNNPTGKVIAQSDLIKIVEAFPDIYVIIDEAYADFDDTTMLDYIETYKNLLVTRTLSKAFALAGIRCGFMIGHKETMNMIKAYKVPYNVNRMTQLVGTIVLKHTDEIVANINEIKAERDAFYAEYLKIDRDDIVLYPSHTNYLYGKSTRKEAFMNALKEKNIVIRDYSDDSFRITIASKEINQMILDVLKSF